jgi:hypothetical protein
MGSFTVYSLHHCNDDIEVDEMDRERSMHGSDDKLYNLFGREKPLGRTRLRFEEENIY